MKMAMSKLGLLLLLAFTATAAIGCENPVPDRVTYYDDIQPLMGARCVRCHGAGDMLNADPYATGEDKYRKPPPRGYFDHLEDRGCPGAGCKLGLLSYTGADSPMPLYLPVMPPAPAPVLTDREYQLISIWILNPILGTPKPNP
jgi:hypothetical protein